MNNNDKRITRPHVEETPLTKTFVSTDDFRYYYNVMLLLILLKKCTQ